MSAPVEPDIGHLDAPTPPALDAIATVAEAAHAIMDVCAAHRAKALAGGFPPAIADQAGAALWSFMMARLFNGTLA